LSTKYITFTTSLTLKESVVEALTKMPVVIAITKTSGDYDLHLTAMVDLPQSFEMQDQITRVCGITKIEAIAKSQTSGRHLNSTYQHSSKSMGILRKFFWRWRLAEALDCRNNWKEKRKCKCFTVNSHHYFFQSLFSTIFLKQTETKKGERLLFFIAYSGFFQSMKSAKITR